MGIEVGWFLDCMQCIDNSSKMVIIDWRFLFAPSSSQQDIDTGIQKSALPHVGPLVNARYNNRSLPAAFSLLIGWKFYLDQSESCTHSKAGIASFMYFVLDFSSWLLKRLEISDPALELWIWWRHWEFNKIMHKMI